MAILESALSYLGEALVVILTAVTLYFIIGKAIPKIWEITGGDILHFIGLSIVTLLAAFLLVLGIILFIPWAWAELKTFYTQSEMVRDISEILPRQVGSAIVLKDPVPTVDPWGLKDSVAPLPAPKVLAVPEVPAVRVDPTPTPGPRVEIFLADDSLPIWRRIFLSHGKDRLPKGQASTNDIPRGVVGEVESASRTFLKSYAAEEFLARLWRVDQPEKVVEVTISGIVARDWGVRHASAKMSVVGTGPWPQECYVEILVEPEPAPAPAAPPVAPAPAAPAPAAPAPTASPQEEVPLFVRYRGFLYGEPDFNKRVFRGQVQEVDLFLLEHLPGDWIRVRLNEDLYYGRSDSVLKHIGWG